MSWTFENGFKRAKKCGFMLKSNEKDQWLLRWFVLQDNFLYYFDNIPEVKLKGSLPLSGVTIESVEDGKAKYNHAFKIVSSQKKEYYFGADDAAAKKEWIEGFQEIMRLAKWRDKKDDATPMMEGVKDDLQPLFNPKKTGWLRKQSFGNFGNWKDWLRRWFCLHDGFLYYYQDQPDITSKGQIPVERCEIEKVADEAHPFRMKLSVMGRTFHLCAEDEAERFKWMEVINPKSVVASIPFPSVLDRPASVTALTTAHDLAVGGSGASSASLSAKKEYENLGVKFDVPSLGKHTIRIYDEKDLFSTYIITDETTTEEALSMVVRKLRIDEDPSDFGLFEKTDRIFMTRVSDGIPLINVLNSWREIPNWRDFRLVFKTKRSDDIVAEVANCDDDDEDILWKVRAMDMFINGDFDKTLLDDIGEDNATELPTNDQIPVIETDERREYQVQVHVIEAREIRGVSKSATSDPIIHVKCHDKVQKSDVYKASSSFNVEKLMTFDFTMLQSEFFSGSVLLEVYDHNLLIDKFIGMYQFDISSVYQSNGHECYKQWVPISDLGRKKLKDVEREEKEKKKAQEKAAKKAAKKAGIEEDEEAAAAAGEGETQPLADKGGRVVKESDIQGYLLVSVTVLGPGDALPIHMEDEDEAEGGGGDGGDLDSSTLTAPDIKTENFYLNVRVFCGEAIFKQETLGGLSTYIEVRFAGSRPIRSQVASGTEPEWKQELKVPVKVPLDRPMASDIVYVRVVQSRLGIGHGRDLVLGTATFSFNGVKAKAWGPKWYNIYGAPARLSSSAECKAMNLGQQPGTEFRGRILCHLLTERAKNPVVQIRPLGSIQKPKTNYYSLRFDLYEVNGLPSGPAQLEVKLKWGEHRLPSSSVFSLNGTARWAVAFEELRVTAPANLDELPDIFINVYKKSIGAHHRLGLLRIKCADIMQEKENGFKHEVNWSMLQHDTTSMAYSKGELAGFILYRLDFGLTANVPRGARPKIIEPEFKHWAFRSHIFQAEDLLVADLNGLSDPYVNVSIAGQKDRTPAKDECLNPVWYHTVHFDVELSENLPPPELMVVVKDESTFQIGNPTVLGRFTLPMSAVPRQRLLPEPRWFDLYLEKPTDTHGRIMASFQLIPKELSAEVPLPNLVPSQRPVRIEILVVGLRGVPAYQLRDLISPVIEFDIGDRSDKSKILSTKTQVRPGPNSTFLDLIEFRTSLPTNEIYAGVVNVRIVDRRGAGLVKYLVGDTSIPLKPHLPWGLTMLRKYKQSLGEALADCEEDSDAALYMGGSVATLSVDGSLVDDGDGEDGDEGEGEDDDEREGYDEEDETGYDDEEEIENDRRSRMSRRKKKYPKKKKNRDDDDYDDDDIDEEESLLGGGGGGDRASNARGRRKQRAKKTMKPTVPSHAVSGSKTEDAKKREGILGKAEILKSAASMLRTAATQAKLLGTNVVNNRFSLTSIKSDGALDTRTTLTAAASQLTATSRTSSTSRLTTTTATSSSATDKTPLLASRPSQLGTTTTTSLQQQQQQLQDSIIAEEDAAAAESSSESEIEDGPLKRPKVSRPLEKDPKYFNIHFDEYVIGRLKPLTKPLQKTPAGKLKLHIRVIPLDEEASKVEGGGLDPNVAVVPRIGAPFYKELPMFYQQFDCVVRLYIIRGINLKAMDTNGFSDPYCVISWGKRFEVKDGKSWQRPSKMPQTDIHQKTLNPEFRYTMDLKSTLPGNSEVEIAVYDEDKIGQDDLIGMTRIDVENRWFSHKWRENNPYMGFWRCDLCKLHYTPPADEEPFQCTSPMCMAGTVSNVDTKRKQPIEIRPLRAQGSTTVTGMLACYMEIWGVKASELYPPDNIQPPRPESFELRIVVFEVTDVKSAEGKADLRVSTQLLLKYAGDITEESEKMKTDVHGGSEDGVGKFNWRFVWPLDLPCKNPRLKIQCWDEKLLASNDALGEVNVSLKRHLDKALKAFRKYQGRFQGVVFRDQWLTLKHPNFEGATGRVRIRMDVIPAAVASQHPVGKGREEPNCRPYLAKPKGRGAARWQLGKRFGNFMSAKMGGAAKMMGIVFCVILLLAILGIVVYIKVFKPSTPELTPSTTTAATTSP